MTIAQVNASTNQGWLVRIENATVTATSGQNTTISQDGNTIVVRGISGVEYEVNDVISVTGNIGCYNNVAQIANPTDVEVHKIPVITADDVTLAYDATSGEIDYTIDNPVAGANLSATTTADWVSGIAVTTDKISFTTTANDGTEDRTATFTLSYEGATDKPVTVIQKHYVPDYATLPFEYDGNGTGDLPQGFTVSGLGTYNSSPAMKFDGAGDYAILKINERPGELTFDIKGNTFSGGTFKVQTSVDGTTFTDLESYTELGDTQSESFDNLAADVRYIKWIYTNKSSGNVALGNIQLAQYVEPSHDPVITLDPSTVNVDAGEHDGTIVISLENLTVEDKAEFGVQYYNGNEPVEELDWVTVEVAEQDPQVGEGFVVSYVVAANEGPTRNAAFKLYVDGDEETIWSDLVTITQAAAPGIVDNYELFTGDLVEGDYLIVYDGKAMNTTVTSNRLQYEEVTATNDVITTGNAAIVWHIAKSGNYWTIYNADANAYAASTGTKNQAQMLAEGTNDKVLWTVFGTATYDFINKYNNENNINATLRNNDTYGFACYATSTGGALSLYKKVEATPTQAVSISSAGMATFCSENALDFTGLTDMYAYIAQYNNDKVTYRKVTKVPARTGVMLRNPNGGATSHEVPVLTGAADDVEGNKFIGTLTEISSLPSVDNDNTNYILNNGENGVGFYKAAGKKVGAGKAYLQIPTPADAKVFIGFEETGEATGIENVNRETTTNGRCYNLNGQQVSGNYKGIVIVNGKKTIVK